MSSRKQRKQEARTRRLELEAQLRAALARRRRMRRAGATALVLVALGGGLVIASGSSVDSVAAAATGPEGVAVPNAPAVAPPGAAGSRAVDGISCLAGEQLLFHIHAHLTVFINGAARQIPRGIGIVNPQAISTSAGPYVASGSCFYWLHTHAADGIIHIESPIRRLYTLGDFFDVWGQKLSARQIGLLPGRVTAFYNERPYTGNPRQIPLTAHAQIQLEIGSPRIAPTRITFPSGL